MKCLLCGNKHTKEITHQKSQIRYHQCDRCHVMFKDPIHFPTPEEEKSRYEEHHNDISQEGYVKFLSDFIDQGVLPFLKEGIILDFGSGPQAVLQILLKRLGYEVHTYDPFYQPNLIDDQHYDMMTSTEVVEHLHNPLSVFKWIDQHVKPQGFISIMTLFYPRDLETFFSWYYQRDISHVIFYQSKTWEWLALKMDWNLIMCDERRIVVFQKK